MLNLRRAAMGRPRLSPSPFDIRPRPLLIGRAGLVVAWSPRSACTHVLLWTLLHEGLLAEAEAYGPWPHKFRQAVYYATDAYRRSAARIAAAEGRGYALLKVVRDPEKRLVSIFRHVCRYPILDKLARRKLGLDIREEGLSLVDFDRILAGLPLVPPSATDPHLCQQRHPVWALGFDRVITLNIDDYDFNAGLNEVEAAFGLPQTDFARVASFERLRETHYARERPVEGEGPIERMRFRPRDIADFPRAQLLASPFLKRMARARYGPDYPGARLSDSGGALFKGAVAI